MAGRNRIAFLAEERIASVNSLDLKNIDSVGCHMIIDMSVISAEGSVTLDSGESDKAEGTIQLASVVPLVAANATIQLNTALANVFSTGTVTLATALANTFSTGTVTLASALATEFSQGTVTLASVLAVNVATGTVTCATAIANDTVTINGLVYTGVNGGKAGDFTKFSVDTSDEDCAIDLADSITQDARSGTLGDVTAVAVGAVVTCTSDETGASGNATTLVSSDGVTLAVSGAGTFTGGVDADFCTINGNIYTAVDGVKSDNTEFTRSGTDISDATDLVDSINNDVRAGTLGIVTATNAGGSTAVVTLTSDQVGTAGDATTLTTSDGGTLAVSGATFSGGVDADTTTINGLVYTAVAGAKSDNTEFSIDGNDVVDATDLVDSINNDVRSGTLGDVSATNAGGTSAVVTCSSDVAGVAGDATTLVSSDGGTLAVSGATFSGGVDADFCTINSLVYTAVDGAKSDNTEFSVDTSDIAGAADLVDSITNDVRAGTLGDVSAANGGTAVVTCTSDVDGVAGDATTLTSSDGGTLAVSGATFGSGVDADLIVVNGLTYTAVAGAKSDNTEFSIDTSNDAAAADLEDSIDNDVRTGTLNDVSASSSTDTVTCTQTVAGAAGNATTLTSTGAGRVILSGATFANGTDADTVTVNGLVYTAVAGAKSDDTEFSIDTSDDAAATDLADSIDDDTREGTLNDLTATAATDTVTAITTIGGTVGNATTLASSDEAGRLTISGSTFTGGADNANVSSITVDGVETMSGTEIFVTDLATTATAIAANITAHTSVPNYNAVAVGTKIELESESGGDALAVVATSAVIATTDVNFNANDITFTLQGKDELSEKYYDILESPIINSVGVTILKVYPGIVSSSYAAAFSNDALPQTYRVSASHTDDSPVTYSVAVNLLN